MSDESIREFQLNGKQLVFLFMASTIVAVVIFLCGVMVGRGATAAQAAVVTASAVEPGDPTAGVVPTPVAVAAPTSAPADVPPVPPGDEPELKYPTSLTADKPKLDLEPARAPATPAVTPTPVVANSVSKSVAKTTAPPRTVAPPPSVSKSSSTVASEAVTDVTDEPSGTGFVVQVAATPRRSEADSIRGRLQAKGYPAFVTTSGRVFRVRVGKYKDRAEANKVSKRLETEERFKPWVTR